MVSISLLEVCTMTMKKAVVVLPDCLLRGLSGRPAMSSLVKRHLHESPDQSMDWALQLRNDFVNGLMYKIKGYTQQILRKWIIGLDTQL